ncbi:MAG TPA: plastocyanin/azurin family copper-binding protein [Thermoplasmata archaeon]
MRAVSIFFALALVMALTLVLPANARAADTPKLILTVEAGPGATFVFTPARIVLPQVPIILNVTVWNSGTTGPHTFSIRDSGGTLKIDIQVPALNDRAQVEFAVNSTNEIYYNGELFQAEALGGGIKFFCVPHETMGMVGSIVVGGTTTAPSENLGIFLRAYWIGLIGLAAMLVWIGITYYIIRSSSTHFRDQRQHLRRGLP